MEFSSWMLFVLVSLATTFTPGPAVLMAISNSVAIGPSRALYASAGNAAGIFIVSSAALSGLAVLLHTSAYAFAALKLLGAAYLIYLGITQWKSRANIFSRIPQDDGVPTSSAIRLFLNGLLVAITNPKGILFFTALFPQFMPPDNASNTLFLLLTATFSFCTVLSQITYISIARFSRRWFSNHFRAVAFNRTLGAVYICLGASLFRLRNSAG
jgi:homoserine/homoserine lactone efflux protein